MKNSSEKTNPSRLIPVVQQGHTHKVSPLYQETLTYSPDGSLLASGDDGIINIYQPINGRLLRVLEVYTHIIVSLCFSPDGKHLAVANSDNAIQIWDTKTWNQSDILECPRLTSVCFSPDGKYLACGSHLNAVFLWNTENLKLIKKLEHHKSGVQSLCFSPGGKYLATGQVNLIYIWNTENEKIVKTLRGLVMREVSSLCFSPDSMHLAIGSMDNVVRIWDLENEKNLKTLKGKAVQYSPDGKRLAGRSDNRVCIWDTSNYNLLKYMKLNPDQSGSANISSISFSPDRSSLAGKADYLHLSYSSVYIWNVENGDLLKTLEGHKDEILSITLSPDTKHMGCVSKNATYLWNIEDPGSVKILPSKRKVFFGASIAFSLDGKHLASGSEVYKLDMETGQFISIFKDSRYTYPEASSYHFSPDGKWLAIGLNGGILRILDMGAGHPREIFEHDSERHFGPVLFPTLARFSPDGKYLACGGVDGKIRIWDIMNLKKPEKILVCCSSPLTSICFSPDGNFLASGSDDKIQIWDTTDRSSLEILQGHKHSVSTIDFSPDSRYIAACGSYWDHIFSVWDVKNGKCLDIFKGKALSARFSPNGKYLLTTDGKRIVAWDYKENKKILYRYLFIKDHAWLDLLPDGRFDASPDGMHYLTYTEEGSLKSCTAEELKEEFYEPEAVKELWTDLS